MNIHNQAQEFEVLVSKIFKLVGYSLSEIEYMDAGYDFILELNNEPKYAVEVKYYKSKHPQTSFIKTAALRLIESSRRRNIEKAILVVSCEVSVDLRNELETVYKITLVDRIDLLIMSTKDTELHDGIRSMFEGDEYVGKQSIGSIIERIGVQNIKITTYPATITLTPREESSYCDELKTLTAGKKNWPKYELLCNKIIRELFDKDLNGWHTQKRTDDGLSRYDLICRITPISDFWKFLIDDVNSRYALFEFKNYRGKIKQGEILTTEKYLLTKALRSVAFIISRKGPDKNGILTIQGAMREHGKLMIPLSDDDLCEMLKMKQLGDDPSDHLFNLVDDFLMTLPR